MQSLKYLYKIGHGPSSSHTMGPAKAASEMLKRYPNATRFECILYGSLALTGKGHLTDKVLIDTINPIPCEVKFDIFTPCEYHPNMLDIIAFDEDKELARLRFYSVGGGIIEIEGEASFTEPSIYELTTFNQIETYCKEKNISLVDFVLEVEGEEIIDFLLNAYEVMKQCVKDGLKETGTLPGDLHVARKAKDILSRRVGENQIFDRKVLAYAYAASEQNAAGGVVVTAPTCGASGVIPAVFVAAQEIFNYTDLEIVEALMVAGVIGNIVKTNASISGAEAGCQAEIGTACAMAAAGYAYLMGSSIDEIEQAAEIALEHHLGLTCDPIAGYVQIPCIERNAVCALRAIDSAKLVKLINVSTNKITFDMVVNTMLATGQDLHEKYRETAEGGLAKEYRK